MRDIQIIHVSPGYRAGCGGIDLFAGGLSFVQADQLIAFFKKVLLDAAGYSFNLALETTVPEIAHVLQYIQQIAQKINNSNMNSCDMAEDLVGGVWPKVRASQQQICQDIGSQSNAFSDWADARLQCSTGGAMNDQLNKAANDSKYKDQVLYNKNIVWDAIRKNSF